MDEAFGYDKTGSPTKAQIFISGEYSGADANGMEPEQVQAAIWVAYKSRQRHEKGGDNYPAQDYADAMKRLAQISWESIPSFDSGHLNEAFDADPAVLAQFHVDMSKVFLDNEGFDSIAEMFAPSAQTILWLRGSLKAEHRPAHKLRLPHPAGQRKTARTLS